MSPPLVHLEALNAAKLETSSIHYYIHDISRAEPYPDKEIEWLEAFLRTVTFMEGMGKGDHAEVYTDWP